MEDSQVSPSRRIHLDHASATTIPFLSISSLRYFLGYQQNHSDDSNRLVSKLWFSTIRSKNFVGTFLTRSKTRPRLILPLMYLDTGKRFILSAPEHYNKEDDKSSSTVTLSLRHDMTSLDTLNYTMSPPVNGLICCIFGSSITVVNPTTTQSVKLPDVTLNGGYMHARLGYDPVEDQYKVLCVIIRFNSYLEDFQTEHLVCTVRSCEKQEWRKIENTTVGHYSYVTGEICIYGAIYYGTGQSSIVRFDVRTENTKLIKAPEESNLSTAFPSTFFLNYSGKLVGVDYDL